MEYHFIDGETAKAMMDAEKDFVLLDTRTQKEFDVCHLPGAILIPDTDIADEAEVKIPDKDTKIFVYCRTGRRSKLAMAELRDLGYTQLYEFGGIVDWKYEVVGDRSRAHLKAEEL